MPAPASVVLREPKRRRTAHSVKTYRRLGAGGSVDGVDYGAFRPEQTAATA